ncbi:MAG: DUF1801 domain-containing protein [Bacteroidetes bacterium]|nr:DUF1801 domain-containing protein [Bacteroidota bacterium]
MQSKATSVEQYINEVSVEKSEAFKKLWEVISKNIPKGFAQGINYGMIGYSVPHSIYPDGYHCDPKLPLPFVGLAAQKNFIALYHMGIYASPELLAWFTTEYPKHCKSKLDMGKSCIRFKKTDEIPFKLIGELMKKMSPKDWIGLYEKNYKKPAKKK